jgi:hypothetical protein
VIGVGASGEAFDGTGSGRLADEVDHGPTRQDQLVLFQQKKARSCTLRSVQDSFLALASKPVVVNSGMSGTMVKHVTRWRYAVKVRTKFGL